LAEYLVELGVKAKYLHSDIDAIERTEIIRDLRLGKFDVLIGVNLLREGLDIPEVSLVAILDADKEGFLRGHTSLIQTCGRAARNVNGHVVMYADTITEAIRKTLEETDRRRAKQIAFNEENGITPRSIQKNIVNILDTIYEADYADVPLAAETGVDYVDIAALPKMIEELRKEMKKAAQQLEFEEAAKLRDRILTLERQFLTGGSVVADGGAPLVKSDRHALNNLRPAQSKPYRKGGGARSGGGSSVKRRAR
jgi:excinuclease ABC subunit B